MPYILIENFAAGLDTRKSALTSAPGTLQRLTNAVVTPGGEIAKRRAFVKVADLTGTFGLAATEANLYAFTRNVAMTPPSFPIAGTGLIYQTIPNPSTTMFQTDFDTFNGQIYLACYDPPAAYPNNNPHYYNGVLTQGIGKGLYVRTYSTKMYGVLGNNLNFSAVGDPTNWSTGTGAGFINLSTQDSAGEQLTSLEVYYDRLAVFSTEAVQLWSVDADPLQNVLDQILRSAGSLSPISTHQYGSGDVLYLNQSGVRSVRARDASNAAAVSDIGSPIDGLIQDIYHNQGTSYFSAAQAILEPIVGRFWMVFPNEIYVLSAFPGPKVTAWSHYTVPFAIDKAVTCNGKVYLRGTDNGLYAYGGVDGNTYDNCGVEVRLPYLSMEKPGTNKIFQALDMTVSGTWTVKNSFDFNNPDDEETLGVFTAPTWRTGQCAFEGDSSHFSLRFYNNDSNPALLSNAAVHYNLADEET